MNPKEESSLTALSYIIGDHIAFNPDKAIQMLRLASDSGDPSAQALLGAFYLMGLFVNREPETALPLLLKAAKNGSIDAQYNLGWYYQYYEGNYSKAVRRYRLAANGGHKGALEYFASSRYGSGNHSMPGAYIGCYDTSPCEESFQMIDRIKGKGAEELCDVGAAYLRGKRFPFDTRIGLLLLEASANAGNARAQYLLGVYYDSFIRDREATAKAFYWFSLSFKKEYPAAQSRLAEMAFFFPESHSLRSEHGFNIYKINEKTHTRYGEDGFDFFGYDRDGYDRDGYDVFLFNRKGIHKETGNHYDPSGFDAYGIHRETKTRYDADGFDRKGFDKYHRNREGYETDKYHCYSSGYDMNGYDRWGYDENGLDAFGVGPDGYTISGFDHQGIHRVTGTKFDPEGFNKEGYDAEGYNKDGFNRAGLDRDGKRRPQ